MMNGFRKLKQLCILLSFAMVLETVAPLGTVNAMAAQMDILQDTVQEDVQEDVQPLSFEDEASDDWLDSYGNVKPEDELSFDEYDWRGPLSAFTFEDSGEPELALDEDAVVNNDKASNSTTGKARIIFPTGEAKLPGDWYLDMYLSYISGWSQATVILEDDFVTSAEWYVPEGKNYTIQLNGHTITSTGNRRFLNMASNSTVTIDGSGPDANGKKGKLQDFCSPKSGKEDGGAFFVEARSTVILKNLDVIRCYAHNGGGVYLKTQSNLKLYNTTFDGNKASNRGGAIYVDGTKVNISMDSDSKLRWNHAGTHGGAIYINDSRAGIYGGARGTLIEHNDCQKSGGGIYVDGSNAARNAGDAIIRNLIFEENRAAEGSGGAMYINCGGCSLSGIKAFKNEAKDLGGAICVRGSDKPKDRDTSFSDLELTGNKLTAKKSYGGGLYAASTQNIHLSGLVTVRDNTADGYTDNIYLWDAAEHAYLVLGSLAAQSRIGVLRKKTSFGYLTQEPTFVDLKCIKYDDPAYHLELSTKVGKEYLLIKPGPPAAAPKPSVTKLDLSQKTKGTVDGTYTTADGTKYDRIAGYASSPSHTNEEIDIVNKYFFSDGYFMDDPDKYNIHLATMGMNVAMASADSNIKGHSDYRYKFDNIKSLLQGIGCKEEDIYINDWYIEKPTDDSIGVAIAKKKIHDKKNNKDYYLVPIAIRSYGYEKEWASNMTLNGKNTEGEANAEASGFRSARTHVVDSLEYFIDHYGLRSEIEQGNVKFWLNGFSRGSATANLTGKYLVDTYGKYSKNNKNKPNQVFAYCYAVPAGGTDTAESPEAAADKRKGYYCIHNIINKVDLTPMVAPELMGFKRYGVDHYVPGAKDAGEVREEVKTASVDNGSYKYTLMYDNEAYITGTGPYNNIRQKMLDQLLGVNQEVNFSDYFKVHGMNAFGTGLRIEGSKYQKTIESWLPDMYTKVQSWDTVGDGKQLTRSNYSGYPMKEGKDGGRWSKGISAQDAFRGLVMLMLSKTPSEKAALSTALGSVTNKLAAPLSTEKGESKLSIYRKLICNYGWKDKNKQQEWLDFFWGKLTDDSYGQPSIKDKSVMSDAELKAFESYFPALMGLVFRLAPQDKNKNNLRVVATFVNNTETILQGHVPEIYLAWLRQYDDYYDSEAKKAYVFSSGGSVPERPTASIESGTYQGTQTLKLESKGSEIYYTIKKDNGKASPLKLYRSGEGITLTEGITGDVTYEVEFYSIRDKIESNGTRTWNEIGPSTNTYIIKGKHKVQFKNQPGQTEYSTAYYAAGEKVKVSSAVTSKDDYSIDHWTVSNEPSKKYRGDSVEFKMPDEDVTVDAHFNPTIVKVSKIELKEAPKLGQPGKVFGAISSIELEASDGSKILYPSAESKKPKWFKVVKAPRSGAFSWTNLRYAGNLTGEEWMFISLDNTFEADGKNYRFAQAINDYHDGDASICADYGSDGTIKILYHPSTFAKPVVKSIEAPIGRKYPYCATVDELSNYLKDEEVTLHFEIEELDVREAVEWNASSYTPSDEGGSYTFTGTLKNADKYDLTSAGTPSITVQVNAKTYSPVPAADLSSGEYINDTGWDEDKYENNNLKVTATVKAYEGNPGTVYYKAEEYTTTGTEPAGAPALADMTKVGDDGKILLEGTPGATRKYKLWLRGYNDGPDVKESDAVSYTYDVTVPKFRNAVVEVWNVNDPSKALYVAEPVSLTVGEPVYYFADEVLETSGIEGLCDAYTGAYWTSGVSADKIVDPEFYLEKMPDEDITIKLFAAPRIDRVTVYTDGDVTPVTGEELYAEADETKIVLGGREYTLSGNAVELEYTPDDETAMGSTNYTLNGSLSFDEMKAQGDNPVIDLKGKYSLSNNIVVEIVSPGESEKIMASVDAEDEDEDGLYEEIEFHHTFAMTEKPEIIDVYDPEDVVIPWKAGDDRSYEKLVAPKLPESVHVITDDGSLSSLPVEWGLPYEPEEGYDESSVRPQNLSITGYVDVPDGYKAYDLYDDTFEVDRYEVEVSVTVEGAPSVKMPKPDPDGAIVECRVLSGNAVGSIDVALSCETEGAEIYYTVDGTDPLEKNGAKAAGAQKYVTTASGNAINFVTITGKPDDEVTLKVAAAKSGMQPSEIYTNFFEFVRPEAPIPEYDLEDIYELSLEPGQKLSDLKLPDGWHWDLEAMDDPATIPEDDEYEPGDVLDAAVYYNPDPDNYEDALLDIEIPIMEKEYSIEAEGGNCMTYTLVSADEIPGGDEGYYTPYEDGYYLTRVYSAPKDETVVVIFNEKSDNKDYASLIKKTASGKDITLKKEPQKYGPDSFYAEFVMPGEDVIFAPVYEKKGEYKAEGLTVDKQSLSMNTLDKAELNVTVTYSSNGKGDKPKPQLSESSGLIEQVGDAVADGDSGRYKFTIRAVKPGQGTLWISCGDKSQPVTININSDKQRSVNVVNGKITEVNGKAVEDAPTSCYVPAGSSVTLEADPPSSLYIFDRWVIKGADLASSDTVSHNKITFTVNKSVEAEATYIEDPDYKKNEEKQDTDKKVKGLTLKAADGSKSIVFDVNGKGSDLEKVLIATATYYDGSQPEITFESSNTNVVGVKRIGTARTGTVSANIVAMGSGEAVVTAYCGDKSAAIQVSVAEKSNNAHILMDGDEIESFEMFIGEQRALTTELFPLTSTDQVTGISWKIVKDKNNKNVVSVQNGLVTAKKAGTAVVEAILKVKPIGQKKAITLPAARCTITVKAGENDNPKNKQNDKTYKLSLNKSSLKIDRTAAPEQVLTIKLTPKKPLTADQLAEENEITVDSTNYDVVEVIDQGDLKKDDKGKTAQAAIKLSATGPGTAYIIVKAKQGEGQENIAVCKITVTTPVKTIKIDGDSGKLIESADEAGNITIKLKQGSYDRLYYVIDPTDTTDIGKIKWTSKGGVTVKNGLIYAKSVSKIKAGKAVPATVTVKCGKQSHTINVIVE